MPSTSRTPRPGPGTRSAVLVGFGRVGRAVGEYLGASRAPPGLADLLVVGIVDRDGALSDPNGIDLQEAVQRKSRTGRLRGPGWVPRSAVELIEELQPTLVVDTSISDILHGEPGRTHLLAAFRAGASVVTAAKAPIALHLLELSRAARRAGCRLRFSASVGGAVPLLETISGALRAARVLRVRASLNATSHFIVRRVGAGTPWAEAVAEAQGLGLAERDPRWDLNGYDAALKGAILYCCLFGRSIAPESVPRDPLTPARIPAIRSSRRAGRPLLALTDVDPRGVSVRFRPVPRGSPWDADGPLTVAAIETERAGTLWLSGLGAGPEPTATAVLNDLVLLDPRTSPDRAYFDPGARELTPAGAGPAGTSGALRPLMVGSGAFPEVDRSGTVQGEL